MYVIEGLCPRGGMGGFGFNVHLSPDFRHAVALSGLTQQHINTYIKTYHRQWLDATGWKHMYDPDNSHMRDYDRRQIPTKEARELYNEHSISVRWGEWGPEAIQVPGSASGIFLEHYGIPGIYGDKGVVLAPHNMDGWMQNNLVLLVFTELAYCCTLEAEYRTN